MKLTKRDKKAYSYYKRDQQKKLSILRAILQPYALKN